MDIDLTMDIDPIAAIFWISLFFFGAISFERWPFIEAFLIVVVFAMSSALAAVILDTKKPSSP
jgi:hypothetical protein